MNNSQRHIRSRTRFQSPWVADAFWGSGVQSLRKLPLFRIVRIYLLAILSLGLAVGTLCEDALAQGDNTRIIVADKITRGRTPEEKIYEYVLPANEWVITSLWIAPHQEVLIHHFTSSERVTVKLGSLNDSRLQRPGTILPLYTSRNCSSDRGVSAKVTYTCVQISKSEGVKLFARNAVRVGIAVKNR